MERGYRPITKIMGNTPKVDIGWTRPLQCESAGLPVVPEWPYPLNCGLSHTEYRPPGIMWGHLEFCAVSGRLLARGPARHISRDDRRVDVLEHGLTGDHDPLDVLAARHLVHHR